MFSSGFGLYAYKRFIDVPAKIFRSIDFVFQFLAQFELLVSEMRNKLKNNNN